MTARAVVLAAVAVTPWPSHWQRPLLPPSTDRSAVMAGTTSGGLVRASTSMGWGRGARGSSIKPPNTRPIRPSCGSCFSRDNDGYTVLHWAVAQCGNDRVVKALLNRGVDPFAESNGGRTALSYRAQEGVKSATLETGSTTDLMAA